MLKLDTYGRITDDFNPSVSAGDVVWDYLLLCTVDVVKHI